MALIETTTIADMRARLGAFFDQTATIFHQQTTTDDTGGSTGGYPTTPDVSNIPCMVRPSRRVVQGEAVGVAQLQNVTLWDVRMPEGTVVAPTDRIAVGAIGYEVRGVSGIGQSDNVNTVATCVVVR